MTPKTISTKARWSSAPAHMALGKLQPPGPALGAPKGKQKACPWHQSCKNPGQMCGGFSAATKFYVLKKNPVHVKMAKLVFPLMGPAPELTAWVLKRSANPSISWGIRPSPPTPPQSPNPSKVNVSPQTKRQVQCSG